MYFLENYTDYIDLIKIKLKFSLYVATCPHLILISLFNITGIQTNPNETQLQGVQIRVRKNIIFLCGIFYFSLESEL